MVELNLRESAIAVHAFDFKFINIRYVSKQLLIEDVTEIIFLKDVPAILDDISFVIKDAIGRAIFYYGTNRNYKEHILRLAIDNIELSLINKHLVRLVNLVKLRDLINKVLNVVLLDLYKNLVMLNAGSTEIGDVFSQSDPEYSSSDFIFIRRVTTDRFLLARI